MANRRWWAIVVVSVLLVLVAIAVGAAAGFDLGVLPALPSWALLSLIAALNGALCWHGRRSRPRD